ncbi:hypothetical protein R3P38DRAFT_3166554 [Favolaschia claudopus]|uniref:Secreted protein n=1 Tax=Favolaschia claudopus TaxID=2862362 RepID=A0AAW0E861_9AGAR
MHRALRFTQKREFVSSLFGFTFVAAVVTVSAPAILPCPARSTKGRYADSDSDGENVEMPGGGGSASTRVTVAKRPPRRWIEEVHPIPNPKQQPKA